ncbi:MAG: hypothetical protein J0M15_15020 [Deltaproteobacteria bacterium]|nr:hypothetical protein [Deltaproteobacteria bacterium]
MLAAGLPNVGTAGTYTKVTTDSKGRVTSGTTLAESDIPTLSTAGKVSGGALNPLLTLGTIGGSTSINSTGNLVTTGTGQGAVVGATNLRIFNGANYVELAAPALGGYYQVSMNYSYLQQRVKVNELINQLWNKISLEKVRHLRWLAVQTQAGLIYG